MSRIRTPVRRLRLGAMTRPSRRRAGGGMTAYRAWSPVETPHPRARRRRARPVKGDPMHAGKEVI
jgi:hypothetical protein